MRDDKISEALLLRQRTYFLLRLIVNFTKYKKYIGYLWKYMRLNLLVCRAAAGFSNPGGLAVMWWA